MADEKESSSKYCMTFNLDRFLLQRKVCLIFGPECLRVIQGEKIVDVFQHHCQHVLLTHEAAMRPNAPCFILLCPTPEVVALQWVILEIVNAVHVLAVWPCLV